jgi:hypothetical protein
MNFIRYIKLVLSAVKKGKPGGLHNLLLYPQWKKYLSPEHNSISDELPWITFDAIRFLEKHIPAAAVVFEYGGGGSTLFFLAGAEKVITVEHDTEWFNKLQSIIYNRMDKNKWEAHYIKAENGPPPSGGTDTGHPDDYVSADENYAGANFYNYVSVIDRYPDDYFDCILIDGRSRTSCLKHSFSKLKPGGLLILDNAERGYYTLAHHQILKRKFTLLLNSFGPVPFSDSFSQTNIWKKN